MNVTKIVLAIAVGAVFAVGPITPRANAQIEAKVGEFILGYFVSKLADQAFDLATGKPDTRELQQRLEYFAQNDARNAVDIYELKKQVAACATREEVKAALLVALRKVDATLADHAIRLYDLEVARRELERKQAELYSQLKLARSDLNRLAGAVENQGQRLTKVETELAELKRWDNAEMSMRLAVAGSDKLLKEDYPEAIRLLTQAHAYAPEDPGVPYVLGIAYHLSGKEEEANLWIAKGIAAERLKVPALWFTNTLPRYQGRLRTWFDGKRYDPVLGSKSSGTIRVIEFTPDGPVRK
ncbi:MAG: hypothetical protein K2V38_25735 [Gemmataceae bacterium]|nr:hypothetical protein [Gemmataceae bacterium]